MGIEMPAEVRWLIPIVVGDSWPEGDETALQRLGDVWKQAATDVDEAMRQAEDAVKQATSHMDGEAAEAFKKYWEKFVKGEEATLPKMKDVSEKLATACRNCAMQIEYAKLSIIIALVLLAIQIAVMLASAVVSFGASTAGIVPAQLATRAGVQIVFRQLVQRLMQQVGRNLIGKLALQVGIEVATSVATDLAVQGIQLAKGTRDTLDTSLTLDAAKSGLISGVVGAGVGAGTGKALGDGLGDSLGRSIGRNAAEEAITGAGSALAEGALSEEGIKASDVLFGATSGAVSGSVSGAKSGIEGLNADIDVPTAGDMPSAGDAPPRADVPRADAPRTDVPRADVPRADGPTSTPDAEAPPRRSSDATNMSYAAPPVEQPQHRVGTDTTPASTAPPPPSQQPQGFQAPQQSAPAAPAGAPPAPAAGNAPATPRSTPGLSGGGFSPGGASPMGGGHSSGNAPSPGGGHSPAGGPTPTSGNHSQAGGPTPTAAGGHAPGTNPAAGGPTPTAGGHSPNSGSPSPNGPTSPTTAHPPNAGGHAPTPSNASPAGVGHPPNSGVSGPAAVHSSGPNGPAQPGGPVPHGASHPSGPNGPAQPGSPVPHGASHPSGSGGPVPSGPPPTSASHPHGGPSPVAGHHSPVPAAGGHSPSPNGPANLAPAGFTPPGGTNHGPSPNGPIPGGPQQHRSPAGDAIHQAATSTPAPPAPFTAPPGRHSEAPGPSQSSPPGHGPAPQGVPQQQPRQHNQRPQQSGPHPRSAPPQRPVHAQPAPHTSAPPHTRAPQHAQPPQHTQPRQHAPQPTPQQHPAPQPQRHPVAQQVPPSHGPTPQHRPADTSQPHERQGRSQAEDLARQKTPVTLPDHLKHLQDHAAHTKAGLSLHERAGSGWNRMDGAVYSATTVAPDPHRYTVDVHGSADNVRVGDTKLTPKDVADIIRSSGDWDGKQPIRLLSCQTGTKADGFAAKLSQELGVEVVAPTKDAWVDDMGNVFASSTHYDHKRGGESPGWPPNGDWATFKPDRTSSKHERSTAPGTTPTWGDNVPEQGVRAHRRGEPMVWVRDRFGNAMLVPASHVAPPHQVRQPPPPPQHWGPPPNRGQRPPLPNQGHRPVGPPPNQGRRPVGPPPGPVPPRFPQQGQPRFPQPSAHQQRPPLPPQQQPNPGQQRPNWQPPAPGRDWRPVKPLDVSEVQWHRPGDERQAVPSTRPDVVPPPAQPVQHASAPERHPATAPEPVRQPSPTPEQRPESARVPEEKAAHNPEPVHDIAPVRDTEPAHDIEPVRDTEPAQDAEPIRDPEPAHDPAPVHTPEPVHAPEPTPAPEPIPDPAPKPQLPPSKYTAAEDRNGIASRLEGCEPPPDIRREWAQKAHDLREDAIAKGATDYDDPHSDEARAHGAQAAPEGAALHFEDISDQAAWRISNEELYRFDNRDPIVVFGEGFHVSEHKQGGTTRQQVTSNSGRMVSVTRDSTWYTSKQFGGDMPPQIGDVAYNYVIDAPGGLDVLATLEREGHKDLLMSVDQEAEIGFLGGIDRRYIKEAVEVKWNGTEWVPTKRAFANPHYEPHTTDALRTTS